MVTEKALEKEDPIILAETRWKTAIGGLQNTNWITFYFTIRVCII